MNAITEAIPRNVLPMPVGGAQTAGPALGGGFAATLAVAQGSATATTLQSSGGVAGFSRTAGGSGGGPVGNVAVKVQIPAAKKGSCGPGLAGSLVVPAALAVTATAAQLTSAALTAPALADVTPVGIASTIQETASASRVTVSETTAAGQSAGLNVLASGRVAANGAVSQSGGPPSFAAAPYALPVPHGRVAASSSASGSGDVGGNGLASGRASFEMPSLLATALPAGQLAANGVSVNVIPGDVVLGPAGAVAQSFTFNPQQNAEADGSSLARGANAPAATVPDVVAMSESSTNADGPQQNITNGAADLGTEVVSAAAAALEMLSAIVGNGKSGASPVAASPAAGEATILPATKSSSGNAATAVRANPSLLAPALSPSAATAESGAAGQTPFAVFFSGPGAGTESAAAVLPKMILPGTGAAIRTNNGAFANASGASQQSGGENGSTVQNAAAPPGKVLVPGSQNDNLLRRDANPNSANAPGVSAPPIPAAAPVPVSGAASLAVVASPLPVAQAAAADSSAKPDVPPAPNGSLPSAAAAVPQSQPTALPGPVQMAQMVNRIGQSEMRIGMNTTAFGSVEVRTVVHASDVGLIIGSEKGDLRGLLTNEMPALTNSLQQQNLRLNSVSFTQGFGSAGDMSGGGNFQQRSFSSPVLPQLSAGRGGSDATEAGNDAVEALPAGGWAGGNRSLSVLA